ncbi:TniQ family protein [Rhizobium sp. 768_B6_N1_8]|uniref:TniQ family protein n=1 Tax=unclassified Rhizobium TaxID=2613769 RepID=UPI003F210E9F
MGFDLSDVINGKRPALERLAEFAQVSPEKLYQNALISKSKSRAIIRGEPVRSPIVLRYRTRLCPKCIQNDRLTSTGPLNAAAYIRVHWQFSFIRACPIHNVPIISLPDQTNSKVFDIAYQLTESALIIREATASEETRQFSEFEQFALDRLNGQKGHGELLDKLPLAAAGDISELFGIFTTFGKFANLEAYDETQWHLAAQSGFNFLKRNFEGVRDFGKIVVGDLDTSHPLRGGNNIFGTVNQAIGKSRPYPEYDIVRDELVRMAEETLPLSPGVKIFGRAVEAKHVPFEAAVVQVPQTRTHLRAILRHIENADDGQSIFHASSVEAAAAMFRDLVPAGKAAQVLGIVTGEVFRQLAKAGIVKHDEVFAEVTSSTLKRYSIASLHELVEAAQKVAPVAEPNGLSPLTTAVSQATIKYFRIVELLLAQELTTVFYDRSAVGLAQILVDPNEIRALSAVDERWVTSDEVAAELGVGVPIFHTFVRSGLIQGHRLGVSRYRSRTLFFDRQEVRAFHEKYVSSAKLGENYNLSSAAVSRRMFKLQVPVVRADNFVLYLRTEAEALMRENAGVPTDQLRRP